MSFSDSAIVGRPYTFKIGRSISVLYEARKKEKTVTILVYKEGVSLSPNGLTEPCDAEPIMQLALPLEDLKAILTAVSNCKGHSKKPS